MSVHHDTRSGALDALSDAHLEAGRIKTPRERAKHWLEEQTSISLAVAVVGAFALTLELVGSTLLLVQGGLSRVYRHRRDVGLRYPVVPALGLPRPRDACNRRRSRLVRADADEAGA
jgi:hypothetical protein